MTSRLVSRVIGLWVRPEVSSEQTLEALRALHNDPAVRLCYVLETGGVADSATLASTCRKLGLPDPDEEFVFGNRELGRSLVILRPSKGLFLRRRSRSQSRRLTMLIEAATAVRDAEPKTVEALPLFLVPVGIYWGRAPGKERGWFSMMFNEDWEVAGRLRKALTTFLHGRHTLLQFSEPMAMAPILHENLDGPRTLRMASRVLRVHFRLRRQATVGPDLSHRRTLINEVISDAAVRALINDAGPADSRARRRAEAKAQSYAMEIAADLSYSTVRFFDRLLTWLWNRIYDGIRLGGTERLHEVVEGSELVYVPCHRSHFDYLLLSYVLYKQGLSLPYIAAGINLNLPVVGGMLRRGGAFFLRRSFSGNRLYASVFHAYVKALQTRGYPLEYFIEGGRSRTGRLLPPKVGMLSMTIQAFLADSRRPVKFVPVYFGYERLIEGTSFISELRGDGKKKESLFGLVRSLRRLRETFGEVYVNFGEPIDLADYLDTHAGNWRESELESGEKPEWLSETLDQLGWEILERINSATAVTPISMLALALLGTPRHALAMDDLKHQLKLYQKLFAQTPYSASTTMPDMSVDEIIAHGLDMGAISIESDKLGEIAVLPADQAVLLTYFRNNILHLTAVHALVAACFINERAVSESELERFASLVSPYIRMELRLRWREDDLPKLVRIIVKVFCGAGMLIRDGEMLRRPPAGAQEAHALSQLGQAVVPILQRYFMAIVLMHRYGSGSLTQGKLEALCQLCAERLSILYGMRSPDFFDKRLFRAFASALRDSGVTTLNADRCLEYEFDFDAIEQQARRVLGEPLRQAILVVTEVPENLVLGEQASVSAES
ncbi:MAG: glycerol-3-phosphate 1-O-acyltransferase PlsB [Pseudomonadota bacterium]